MRSAVDETDDDMYTQQKLEGNEGKKIAKKPLPAAPELSRLPPS